MNYLPKFEPELDPVATEMRDLVEREEIYNVEFLHNQFFGPGPGWTRYEPEDDETKISVILHDRENPPCVFRHELAHALHVVDPGVHYRLVERDGPHGVFDLAVHPLVYDNLTCQGVSTEELHTEFVNAGLELVLEPSELDSIIDWLNLLVATHSEDSCRERISSIDNAPVTAKFSEILDAIYRPKATRLEIEGKYESLKQKRIELSQVLNGSD